MKLIVKGRYHNNPAELHFDVPGIVEVDAVLAAFLLRDAPDNFAVYSEPVGDPAAPQTDKAVDEPAHDKMQRAPKNKK